MLIVVLVSMLAGFIIAQFDFMARIIDIFRFDSSERGTPAPEPEPVVKVVHDKDVKVTIYPKQKKGRGARYYPEETKRMSCNRVVLERGKVNCLMSDCILDEDFDLKDIETMIIY